MFNFVFHNLNTVCKPSLLAKINLWFFVDAQVFKNKFNNHIMYFIENMSNLKVKTIKVYFHFSEFEAFYFASAKYLFFTLLLFMFFI